MRAVLFLIACLVVVSKSDQCTFKAGVYYDYTAVMKCFTSIPFDSTIAKHTTDNMLKAMELYAFKDIAADPPDSKNFNPKVNLTEMLNTIGSSSFSSDFEFQEAVRRVFLQLHDAHTNYYAPKCYGWTFTTPNSFLAYDVNGQTQVEVAPEVLASYVGDTRYSSIVGTGVSKIEGLAADEWLADFGRNHVGLSKDAETRKSISTNIYKPQGFGGPWVGLATNRPAHFSPAPLKRSLDIELFNGTTVKLPWVASAPRSFADYSDFVSYWKPSKSGAAVKGQQPAVSYSSDQYQRVASRPAKVAPRDDAKITPLNLSVENGLGFYQLGNDTLVMYQNTFAPTNYYTYSKTILDSFLYAQFTGLTKVVLDLTLNGGGDICLGRSVLEFLYGEKTGFKNFGPTDLPSSVLARNISNYAVANNVTQTPWSPDFYQTPQGNSFTDTSWLIPGISRTRGGSTRAYSQLLEISSNLQSCGKPPFILQKPLAPDRLLILSRGFCGSTCALFSDELADQLDVRTLVLSNGAADPEVQQTWRSFPGLQVLGSADIYQVLEALGQQPQDQSLNTAAPRALMTSAAFRLCNREIYKNGVVAETTKPLEYTFQPSSYRQGVTREIAFDPTEAWQQALTILNSDTW